jgi:hypothetical protein
MLHEARQLHIGQGGGAPCLLALLLSPVLLVLMPLMALPLMLLLLGAGCDTTARQTSWRQMDV